MKIIQIAYAKNGTLTGLSEEGKLYEWRNGSPQCEVIDYKGERRIDPRVLQGWYICQEEVTHE
jgi:hypothetical protein